MPTGLQPVPFGHSGTDPRGYDDSGRPLCPGNRSVASVRSMPSFDVVSEIDQQEIRNAVDQASREVATRYDFKGTDTTIELSTTEIKLHSSSQDRLAALRQL